MVTDACHYFFVLALIYSCLVAGTFPIAGLLQKGHVDGHENSVALPTVSTG